MGYLKQNDPQIEQLIEKELARQRDGIELIASENYPSLAGMEAAGSILTCKYAEGYPGARYYGGCEVVDEVEKLAIERAKELFGCEHVNVQPHSGTSANLAAFGALLKPGDKILSMSLKEGGHLSFGSKISISGRIYQTAHYGVDTDTGYLDYDAIEAQAMEFKPRLIIAGASAYPRTIDFKRFREIADACGAYLLADISHISGLVASGLHPSPIPYADVVTTTTHKTLRGLRGAMIMCKEPYAKAVDKAVFPGEQGGPLMHIIAAKAVCFGEALKPEFKAYQKQILAGIKAMEAVFKQENINMVTGGSDNHLILLNLTGTALTGRMLEDKLGQCRITVNKNMIPLDPLPPRETSGVRIGTAAITSRGMGSEEAAAIAGMIAKIIKEGDLAIETVQRQVSELTERFPLYPELG